MIKYVYLQKFRFVGIFVLVFLAILFVGQHKVKAEYGEAGGHIYMWFDPGGGAPRQKIPLVDIYVHRQPYKDSRHDQTARAYCEANKSNIFFSPYADVTIQGYRAVACYPATLSLRTRTNSTGYYIYGDASIDGCTWGGNPGLPVGYPGTESGCAGWRGLSCGEIAHRWTPYFPQNYDLSKSISNPQIRNQIDFDQKDMFGGGEFKVPGDIGVGAGDLFYNYNQCKQILPKHGIYGVFLDAAHFCENYFPWHLKSAPWTGKTEEVLGVGGTNPGSHHLFYSWAAPSNSSREHNFDFEWIPKFKQVVPCGNGSCDTGETCDGDANCVNKGVFTPGECRNPGSPNECTYCGDGVKQGSEECDDGNKVDTDSCTNNCTVYTPQETQCADECDTVGESCDDGTTCQQISGVGLRCVGNDYDQCDYDTHIGNNCSCPETPQEIGCEDECPTAGESCDDGTTCTQTDEGLLCLGNDWDQCDLSVHLANDCSCPETPQENPDFTAEKTADIQCINNDTQVQIDYTITVTNTSDVSGTILTVQDTYDSRFQSSWVSDITPTPDSHTGNVITWNNGGSGYTIEAGGNLIFTYRVTMPVASSGETQNGTWVPYTFENFAIVRPEEGDDIELTTSVSEMCVPTGELPPTGITDSVVTPTLSALLLIVAGAVLIRYQGGVGNVLNLTTRLPIINTIAEKVSYTKKERFERKTLRDVDKK